MASPQIEDGYFRIANELAEALARHHPPGASGQVLWAVLRKTYGWQKKADAISISQLMEFCGLSRRSVIYALQDLEAKKMITITRKHQETNLISFNKDHETWLVQNFAPQTQKNRENARLQKEKLVQNFALVQNHVKNEQSFAPTKDTITKDKKIKIVPKVLAPQIDEQFLELSRLYLNAYHDRYPQLLKTVSATLIDAGAKTLQQLVTLDRYNFETEIKPALRFALNDKDFWALQVRSLASLRKKSSRNGDTKFANLLAASMRNGSKPKPKIHPIDEIL